MNMKKTLISLGFDTEDIFMPDEYDFDGLIKIVVEILDSYNLKGSFCLTGDKLRRLVSKNRNDVIDSLKRHFVESHTDSGSRHPNVLEYLEGRIWEDGVREALAREKPLFDLIREVFGRDSLAMNAHNNAHGAQLLYALSLMKKGARLGSSRYHKYLGKNKSVGWFCNTVFLAGGGVSMHGLFNGKWDNKFIEFQDRLASFKSLGMDMISGNVFHVMEMKAKIMPDRFWAANGVNLPFGQRGKWGMPPLRSEKETSEFIENFNKYCAFISEQSWLKNVGLGEIISSYSCQPLFIRDSDIEEIISLSLQNSAPHIGGFFSPAEVLVAAAESLLSHEKTGKLPSEIKRRNILGPLEAPNMFPQTLEVNFCHALEMAEKLIDFADKYNCLPHNMEIDGIIFGIGSIFHAICECWLNLKINKKNDKITLVLPGRSVDEKFMLWLPEAGMNSEIGADNILTKPGLNTHYANLYTRLQTWTLKAAFLRDEIEQNGLVPDDYFIANGIQA